MPYCTADDLLTGPLPLPASMDKDQYVQDAADEIDMQIGFMYKTPVTSTAEGDPLPRPVSLLLKRINALLASGRAIIAAAGASQAEGVNAYGRSLVDEARAALSDIATGRMVLEEAERLPDAGEERRGPRIVNVDSFSQTDAFYAEFTDETHDFFLPGGTLGALMRGADPHSG